MRMRLRMRLRTLRRRYATGISDGASTDTPTDTTSTTNTICHINRQSPWCLLLGCRSLVPSGRHSSSRYGGIGVWSCVTGGGGVIGITVPLVERGQVHKPISSCLVEFEGHCWQNSRKRGKRGNRESENRWRIGGEVGWYYET